MLDVGGLIRAIALGIVQGTTEFLPISSSGHLVLVPWLLNWPAPGLVFDTVVHWGTLVAVVAYFRDDLQKLVRAWVDSIRQRSLNPDPYRRLAWLILIGSIPAGLAGVLFGDFFEGLFSRPGWAAAFLLVTGLLLIVSERRSDRPRDETVGARQVGERVASASDPAFRLASPLPIAPPLPTLAGALFIGLAQALAIAPGISRSGATIAAGLLLGLGRQESARFSFLLATPIIFGAGALQMVELAVSGTVQTQAPTLIIGSLVAGITGYLAIRFLLDYLQRHTLRAFAIYCWGIGLLALAVYWLR